MMRRIAIVLVFLIGVGVAVAYVERPSAQPYPFDHAKHVAHADCVLCHQGARQGQRAGMPDLGFCIGCHASPPGDSVSPEAKATFEAALAGEPAPFNRLFQLPKHVFFSHQRHTTVAGVACEACHGAIADTNTPPAVALGSLHMRDCLACHESRHVTVDCTACHR